MRLVYDSEKDFRVALYDLQMQEIDLLFEGRIFVLKDTFLEFMDVRHWLQLHFNFSSLSLFSTQLEKSFPEEQWKECWPEIVPAVSTDGEIIEYIFVKDLMTVPRACYAQKRKLKKEHLKWLAKKEIFYHNRSFSG